MSKRISTILEYLACVYDYISKNPGKYIFRGQSKANWELTSGAYRRILKNKKDPTIYDIQAYHEDLIYKSQINKYHNLHGISHNVLEALAELQHNECATMLIDFSKNALVSLFFACHENFSSNGAVFLKKLDDYTVFFNIRPQMLHDEITVNNLFEDYLIKKPRESENRIESITDINEQKVINYYWEPSIINQRIPAQYSIFIFGNSKIPFINDEKIIINKESKLQILKDLDSLFNINIVTLFNDFTGFAKANSPEKDYQKVDYLENANIEYQTGNLSEAIRYAKKAVKCDPEYYFNYSFLANLHFESKDYENAYLYSSKSLTMRTKQYDMHRIKVSSHLSGENKDEIDKIITEAQDFVKEFDYETLPYFLLSFGYEEKDDKLSYELALKNYNIIYKLAKRNKDYNTILKVILFRKQTLKKLELSDIIASDIHIKDEIESYLNGSTKNKPKI